jgi:hypothetical protein
MTPEQANQERKALLYKDAQTIERRVRIFAEIMVNDFDPLVHVVERRRVTWLEHRNRGYSNPVGGTIEFPPLRTLTLCVPGNDFAAQLVVEQQIREQLAQPLVPESPTEHYEPMAFDALKAAPRAADAGR